jgi:hypothetical protein
MNKPRKRIISNKAIIFIKIAAAALLFFCCSFFFFQNKEMFWNDFKSWRAFFPVFYVLGLILICMYLTLLVSTIESKEHFLGDRYDLAYRVVFTVTLLLIIIRIFFAETIFYTPIGANLPVMIIVLGVISGAVTWLIPKIKDNDNQDF